MTGLTVNNRIRTLSDFSLSLHAEGVLKPAITLAACAKREMDFLWIQPKHLSGMKEAQSVEIKLPNSITGVFSIQEKVGTRILMKRLTIGMLRQRTGIYLP